MGKGNGRVWEDEGKTEAVGPTATRRDAVGH